MSTIYRTNQTIEVKESTTKQIVDNFFNLEPRLLTEEVNSYSSVYKLVINFPHNIETSGPLLIQELTANEYTITSVDTDGFSYYSRFKESVNNLKVACTSNFGLDTIRYRFYINDVLQHDHSFEVSIRENILVIPSGLSDINFNEGITTLPLPDVLTSGSIENGCPLTYTLNVTATGPQANDLNIVGTGVTAVNDTNWQIQSQDFPTFLQNVNNLNANFSSDFSGVTNLSFEFLVNNRVEGTVTQVLNGSPIPDAINLVTTHTAVEDTRGFTPTLVPQIQDADEASKTYSVNFSAQTGDEERIRMRVPNTSPALYASDITLTGTQAEINQHIQEADFDFIEIDYSGTVVLNYTQSVQDPDGDYVQETGSMTFTLTQDGGFNIDTSTVYDWQVNQNNLLFEVASINDNLGNFTAFLPVEYRVVATLDSPVDNANGEFRTFGTGGTSTWDGVDTLTITGTKDQVNSHLESFEWWSRGPNTAFTFVLTIERNINSAGFIQMASGTVTMNTGDPEQNNLGVTWNYNEDEYMYFGDNGSGTAQPSQAVFTPFGNSGATAGQYSGFAIGDIADPADTGSKQYRLTLTHNGPVAGYQNVNLNGVTSTFVSNTLTLEGTLAQINANIGCSVGGCPEILINTSGSYVVTGTLDDLTLSQNAVSVASFTINV